MQSTNMIKWKLTALSTRRRTSMHISRAKNAPHDNQSSRFWQSTVFNEALPTLPLCNSDTERCNTHPDPFALLHKHHTLPKHKHKTSLHQLLPAHPAKQAKSANQTILPTNKKKDFNYTIKLPFVARVRVVSRNYKHQFRTSTVPKISRSKIFPVLPPFCL